MTKARINLPSQLDLADLRPESLAQSGSSAQIGPVETLAFFDLSATEVHFAPESTAVPYAYYAYAIEPLLQSAYLISKGSLAGCFRSKADGSRNSRYSQTDYHSSSFVSLYYP